MLMDLRIRFGVGHGMKFGMEIGDKGSGFGMGIMGSTGVWRFSMGEWGFGTGIGDRGSRLQIEDGD